MGALESGVAEFEPVGPAFIWEIIMPVHSSTKWLSDGRGIYLLMDVIDDFVVALIIFVNDTIWDMVRRLGVKSIGVFDRWKSIVVFSVMDNAAADLLHVGLSVLFQIVRRPWLFQNFRKVWNGKMGEVPLWLVVDGRRRPWSHLL